MSSRMRRGTCSKLSQNNSTIAAIMRLSATGPGRFSSRLMLGCEHRELGAKVGEGLPGRRRRIVGVFEPPLLQQRSDTPCPMLTSSSCFSQGRSPTRSPRGCATERALLAQATEAEVAEFLAKHVDLKTATGLRRVIRHGHLPEREVMTGIGPVGVRQPRVRDRGAAEDDAGRIRFTPAILPPYARRSRSLEVLIPILYLK